MLNTQFSPWPSYTQEEIEAVSSVLASNKVNYWTGDLCREFEAEFAKFVGTRHAVALANGTLALDVALKALGVGPGDEVVVAPRTYIASVSSAVIAGAIPVFADIDRDTQNISAETISRVLTDRTKAIIPVHLAGMPCDMDPIMRLASERGLVVIEDCAQAHGATYKGRSVGSIGHVGAWSFCQDKIITTGGEGGMVTTNDQGLWSAMWSYKDHGKSWKCVYEDRHPPGPRLLHTSFGTNWRMLEMQGAIGLIQLKRMPEWTARRTWAAERISATLRKHNVVRLPAIPNYARHAWYRLYGFVRREALAAGWSRDRIIREVELLGVPCLHGSQSEVYLERAFDNTLWRPSERLPVAKELGESSIALLVHPTLTDPEIDKTCQVLDEVLGCATA
ncbi:MULTISPECIES: DegT/DnrJ/EryC1/StrS family aminotransferase [Bradyrhizobium]|nr:DegT/DnrJ/EryC1/StrS aminotransferase family protein [Bradyrhizobium ottawaense]GMO16399.1 DegT/DnrJ/EryC1/StrS aminotransferase family protein [Bradyrhizobium sp. TM233]GMO63480.1 DegT/DnrJ/EryC1/StrS aminotransferase family protein [Bradyrhizobium ottawaense]GMO77910.1 DegT/DnrJ/EryC1/StrS aminotransferase family protein [Bradyrhizobium ottawaense]GMO94657.1 DegT/DnrJ/EryC1/StrS aminotransferase family protein [Bradyrhizobium ottawaense]